MERLRNYFRNRIPYGMDVQKAQATKAKLALIYAVLAWNIIGLTVYHVLKESSPKTPMNSVDYAKILGIRDANVVQYSGFKKVKEYEIHLSQEEIDEFHKNPENPEAGETSKMNDTTVEK